MVEHLTPKCRAK